MTISKYRSWYLCQISLQIMLLPILKITILALSGHLNTYSRLTLIYLVHKGRVGCPSDTRPLNNKRKMLLNTDSRLILICLVHKGRVGFPSDTRPLNNKLKMLLNTDSRLIPIYLVHKGRVGCPSDTRPLNNKLS